eukprot:1786369-Amphidinium_carterae.1
MIHPARRAEFFGMKLPSRIVEAWRQGGKTQLIFLAEILPVVVAKSCWAEAVRGMPVLWFIDNMAARAAFIGSRSTDGIALKMIWRGLELDAINKPLNWYAWVPSSSNPADDPS